MSVQKPLVQNSDQLILIVFELGLADLKIISLGIRLHGLVHLPLKITHTVLKHMLLILIAQSLLIFILVDTLEQELAEVFGRHRLSY